MTPTRLMLCSLAVMLTSAYFLCVLILLDVRDIKTELDEGVKHHHMHYMGPDDPFCVIRPWPFTYALNDGGTETNTKERLICVYDIEDE